MILTATRTDLSECNARSLAARKLICWTGLRFAGRIVVSTSFGIQSAVTLHLVNRVMPRLPVIWVDTGYLPIETRVYAQVLSRFLNLNLHIVKSDMTPEEMEAKHGRLWESNDVADLNLYDQIRKVEPMQRALRDLEASAWISGLRSEQTDYRAGLSQVRKADNIWRIYPILDWTTQDIHNYFEQHGLPRHPLQGQGYTTVGDAHSSRPLASSDLSDRDTRFRGVKQECGLHFT